MIRNYDLVILLTDHDHFNYKMIEKNSKNYGKYLFDDNSLSSTMEIIDVFEFAKEMRSGNLFENVYEAYEGNEENLFRNIINSISLFEEEISILSPQFKN